MKSWAFDSAKEIGKNVTITERSQLISITPEQIMKIKSLRIENQVIDDEFCDFLSLLMGLILFTFIDTKLIV